MNYRQIIYFAALRLFPIIVSFVTAVLVTRNFDSVDAGNYFYSATFVILLASLSGLGFQQAMVRYFGGEGICENTNIKLSQALVWSISVSLVLTLILYLYANAFSVNVLNKPALSDIVKGHSLGIIGLVVSSLLAHCFQGISKQFLSLIFLGLAANAVFLMLVMFIILIAKVQLSIESLAWVFSACNVSSAIVAASVWYRQKFVRFNLPVLYDQQLIKSCGPLWLSLVAVLVIKHGGLVIAGPYVSSKEIAYFSVSLRMAELSTLLQFALTLFAAPMYAKLWKDNNKDEFYRVIKSNTYFLMIMGLSVLAVFVLFGEYLLALFGSSYSQAAILLTILAIGQFVSIVCISCLTALNMAQFESAVMRAMALAAIVSIPLTFYLVVTYGIIGAASGSALSLGLSGLFVVVQFKKKFNRWPI